ncbi:SRPBCC family protein [Deminuibacter soli]|uniref:Cell division protein n=1 Tax=Deminuibacter soli TaxID=2291815 RepID=A0A3E1NE79_9BACT|nr:SRPBCC family protein [Deminuibacter soli]RFM26152.1 cell division protein [Deminuibacter soli]
MPAIELITYIHSDLETCFDLSRSIDLHKVSTAATNETAVDGVTSGLIGAGEFVTWQAVHFGIRQRLSSKITAYNRPGHFRDEQLKGAFKSIVHDHYFEWKDGMVQMKDVFIFQSPFGFAGRLFERLILTRYMTKLLTERNRIIKEYAESAKGKALLQQKNLR